MTGSDPALKSTLFNGIAPTSPRCWLVIWHKIMSCPGKLAATYAGLLLEPDKSEKGEWYNDDIAFYKSFHASSSPGVNQSLDRLFSLAKCVTVLSPISLVVSSIVKA